MPYGDPKKCRLVVRRPDGTSEARDWTPEQWPAEIGQMISAGEESYRIAGIRREGDVTVVVALPAKRAARRLLG